MKKVPLIASVAATGIAYAINKKNHPNGNKYVDGAIALGSGALTYFVVDKGQKILFPGSAEQVVGGAKTELQQILKKNLTLPPDQQQLATITPTQMKIYANNLFTAMDGAGTRWPDIKSVIDKLESDVDVLNLIQAFGTRAGTSWFASSTPDDLATWFQDDGITGDVNKILETKSKISYRF